MIGKESGVVGQQGKNSKRNKKRQIIRSNAMRKLGVQNFKDANCWGENLKILIIDAGQC